MIIDFNNIYINIFFIFLRMILDLKIDVDIGSKLILCGLCSFFLMFMILMVGG